MLSMIIPTHNEKGNIERIIRRIFKVYRINDIKGEVIVVDDNSQDGTAALARKIGKKYEVQVLLRTEERNLSSAVIAGIGLAKYDIVGVIDADLSHPPELIPKMLSPIAKGKADFTLGSRYVSGGGIEGWPFLRRTISKGAAMLARPLVKIKDPMSGYMMFKKDVVDRVELNPIDHKIALEILAKGKIKNALEVPFVFKDREPGTSKPEQREQIRYLMHLGRLYRFKYPALTQFFLFCIVGGLGMCVDVGIYALLYYPLNFQHLDLGWYFRDKYVAQGISFCFAVTSNFFLNKYFTFRTKGKAGGQYVRYFTVATISLLIRTPLLYVFAEKLGIFHLFSLIIVILLVTIVNFLGSKLWAFREKD